MAEALVILLKLAVKVGVWSTMIFAFLAVVLIGSSTVSVGLNLPVLGDIFGLVQMWMPFNLDVVFLWLMTVTTAVIAYRLASIAYDYLDRLLS